MSWIGCSRASRTSPRLFRTTSNENLTRNPIRTRSRRAQPANETAAVEAAYGAMEARQILDRRHFATLDLLHTDTNIWLYVGATRLSLYTPPNNVFRLTSLCARPRSPRVPNLLGALQDLYLYNYKTAHVTGGKMAAVREYRTSLDLLISLDVYMLVALRAGNGIHDELWAAGSKTGLGNQGRARHGRARQGEEKKSFSFSGPNSVLLYVFVWEIHLVAEIMATTNSSPFPQPTSLCFPSVAPVHDRAVPSAAESWQTERHGIERT